TGLALAFQNDHAVCAGQGSGNASACNTCSDDEDIGFNNVAHCDLLFVLCLHKRAEHHQAENLEQHLRACMCGICCSVILRCHFHHIAADKIDTFEPANEFEHLARGQSAHFGCTGPRCKTWVQTINVK